jgi:uncharacterized protein (TIGR04255 family)
LEIKFKDPNIKNYEILTGELNAKLKKKYPYFEPLKPQEIPSFLLPHVVHHRFRKNINEYPLYQIGPGIVTFNSNGENYANGGWPNFRKTLIDFIAAYKDVLTDELFTSENIEKITLRYIDKIEDARMYPDTKKYFRENLKLSIEPEFVNNTDYKDGLQDISLFQTYKLNDGTSKLLFNIRTITEGSRKLLVDSSVVVKDISSTDSLKPWLDFAHKKLKELFLGLTSNIQDTFNE